MKLFFNEQKKIIIPAMIMALACLIVDCNLLVNIAHTFLLYYNVEMIAGHFLAVSDASFYAITSTLPVCWLAYYERKNRFNVYALTRVSKKKYILSQWLATAVTGALIMFTISMGTVIIALYVLPKVDPGEFHEFDIRQYFNGEFMLAHPFLYGTFFSLWRGFLGFIMATLGYILACYVNNIFIILTTPFIVYLIGVFSLQTVISNALDLQSCYTLVVSAYDVTYQKYINGVAWLIILEILMVVYFKYIRRKRVFDI